MVLACRFLKVKKKKKIKWHIVGGIQNRNRNRNSSLKNWTKVDLVYLKGKKQPFAFLE